MNSFRLIVPFVYMEEVVNEAGDASGLGDTILQIFINYNFPNFYLTSAPTFTYNWYGDNGDQWTVPLGGGVGKLVRFGKMPVDFKLTAYSNVESSGKASDWYSELQVKFLFPKR